MFSNKRFKRVKKDYERKNQANPFFHAQRKGKSSRPWKWLVLGAIAVLVLIIWGIYGISFWQIDTIKISGLTRNPSDGLENIIRSQAQEKSNVIFHQANIFLFDREEAEERIMSTYNFAGVQIVKHWPRTIEVKVSERPYAFIYQEGSQMFYASADAYLIKETPVTEEDKKKYFILENKNSGTLVEENGQIDVSAEYLNFITQLSAKLATATELPVERYIIDQEFNTVKVKFVNGPLAYFSVKDEAGKQLSLLLLVKREKIKDNFSKTNYIDLRYGDRIFINPDFNQ